MKGSLSVRAPLQLTRLLLLALTLSVLTVKAQTPAPSVHPDFSGKWSLELGRSHLAAPFKDVTWGVVRIAHQEPSFSFRRAFIQAGKASTVSFVLHTDGKVVQGQDDGMPIRQSLKWNGDVLEFLTVYAAPRGEARNTVKYALQDGGKTLRADESFRGPKLSYDNIWVFSKVE